MPLSNVGAGIETIEEKISPSVLALAQAPLAGPLQALSEFDDVARTLTGLQAVKNVKTE